MNRITAIALLLIGMLLFMGSCVPIGYVIYHAAVTDPSESISLSDTHDEFTFQSSPGTLARFKIEAKITSSSVQEDPDSFDDEYLARFKFPISYTITDGNGIVLVSEDVTMAWKDGGNISKNNENVTSTGGTLTASTSRLPMTVTNHSHSRHYSSDTLRSNTRVPQEGSPARRVAVEESAKRPRGACP